MKVKVEVLVKDYTKVSREGFDLDRRPIQDFTPEINLFGPIRITSLLSEFSCRKLSDIHLLIAARQTWRESIQLVSYGLTDKYSCISSA